MEERYSLLPITGEEPGEIESIVKHLDEDWRFIKDIGRKFIDYLYCIAPWGDK